MKIYPDIKIAIQKSGERIFDLHQKVRNDRWQGLEGVPDMLELLGHSFKVPTVPGIETLAELTNADLPWAEAHFNERIEGLPTNPGKTFKDWPYYREDTYRAGGKFSHTYQERFWPKFAKAANINNIEPYFDEKLSGIRFDYGDLNDVLALLKREPYTRQAYLPIFFPEDTGAVHKGRIPCSLGYLFNMRNGYLHMTYYIRSVDYIRHFKNDIYMAVRLMQWVLLQLSSDGSIWNKVQLGYLTMHIESFHVFETDKLELTKRINKNK